MIGVHLSVRCQLLCQTFRNLLDAYFSILEITSELLPDWGEYIRIADFTKVYVGSFGGADTRHYGTTAKTSTKADGTVVAEMRWYDLETAWRKESECFKLSDLEDVTFESTFGLKPDAVVEPEPEVIVEPEPEIVEPEIIEPETESIEEENVSEEFNAEKNGLMVFNFEQNTIRTVVGADGEPLFVARDVARALGYKNTNQAIADHCDGVAIYRPIQDSMNRTQQIRVIKEPDVYRLIFGSKLESAKRFQNWVFEEVLPSIRKTGSYTAQPEQSKVESDMDELERISMTLRKTFEMAEALKMTSDEARIFAMKATASRTGFNAEDYVQNKVEKSQSDDAVSNSSYEDESKNIGYHNATHWGMAMGLSENKKTAGEFFNHYAMLAGLHKKSSKDSKWVITSGQQNIKCMLVLPEAIQHI